MYRELTSTVQRPDEPKRRWFQAEDSDLTVWLDADDRPNGFQLSLREADQEHAVTFRESHGLEYHQVDSGETDVLANRTPILIPDGQPHWPSLEAKVYRQTVDLDPSIRAYLIKTLEDLKYAGRSWAGRESELAPYHRWVDALNLHAPERYVDFSIQGQVYGHVTHTLRSATLNADGIIVPEGTGVALNARYGDFEARTAAFSVLAEHLHGGGHSRPLMNEPYPVTLHDRPQSIADVDRTIVGQLGLRNFSQHMNGFVRKPDGLYMWIGIRAKDKPTWPGKLDQLVAGGLPIRISLAENLKKECHEEAGIPAGLAATAKSVGTLSYRSDTHNGLRRDVIFVYDLELPDNFTPRCTDGEVDGFELLPIEEVARLVRETNDFKANCNLVIIDFLIRHGLIDPEMSGFSDLCSSLNNAR